MVSGVRTYRDFASDLVSAVRPRLTSEQVARVELFQSIGAEDSLVIDMIEVAADSQIPLPRRLYDEARDRIVDGVSFQPKMADLLTRTCRDRLVSAAVA